MIDLFIQHLQGFGYTAHHELNGDKYRVVINDGLANQSIAEVNANVSERAINDFADWVDMRIKAKKTS